MAHPNHHLVSGTVPFIGRMFEAAAAHDLPAAAPAPRGRKPAAPALPFVGAILAYQAGSSITVARRLALDEDLFLADHDFVHAPGVKPLEECFPVLPLTACLELMAETAACLAPGRGLLGFEGVTARRWIAVADGGALALTIEGRIAHQDEQQRGQRRRIKVLVRADDGREPAAEATLLFGTHYAIAPPASPDPAAAADADAANAADTALDAARLYAERHLFHGPRFQGLHGLVHVRPDGVAAELRVLPAHDWFASSAQPQLLCDPALLDTVGQLLAVWSMQQGAAAFPVGLERLDLFGPTPAPGTLVPARLRITGRQLKMVSADIDIGDGAGGTWLRISGWKSWQFNWAPQLVAFQRDPVHFLLSEPQSLPDVPADHVCRRVSAKTVAGFDLALLARHTLRANEMAAFNAKARLPQRQLEWLLGRIAAKDAARAWSARMRGTSLALHPAAFGIENDAAGQPRVSAWPDGLPAPCISIAHSEGQAIALAGAGPVGIDIERIAARDEQCLAGFAGAAERQQLSVYQDAERDAWITRLWCAKEAFGKRLGRGVDGAARHFQARAFGADHSLHMHHGPSGAEARIITLRDGDFIIAFDSPAAAQPEETP
jgi:phosphopantetheinyl transferase